MPMEDLINTYKPITLSCEPWRVVEAQHFLTTRNLVDNNQEFDLLESMLEHSKPNQLNHVDYLIGTPFRYPPLNYGSRFGSVASPSLWYGSLALDTAFSESAYYRLLFFKQSTAPFGLIQTQMTAFQANIETTYGIDLSIDYFSPYHALFSHKENYEYSQKIGNYLRQKKMEAFLYPSVRDPHKRNNIAIFYPTVFKQKNEQYSYHHQHWHCLTENNTVTFIRQDVNGQKRYTFSH
jgi:hypothetical protein